MVLPWQTSAAVLEKCCTHQALKYPDMHPIAPRQQHSYVGQSKHQRQQHAHGGSNTHGNKVPVSSYQCNDLPKTPEGRHNVPSLGQTPNAVSLHVEANI